MIFPSSQKIPTRCSNCDNSLKRWSTMLLGNERFRVTFKHSRLSSSRTQNYFKSPICLSIDVVTGWTPRAATPYTTAAMLIKVSLHLAPTREQTHLNFFFHSRWHPQSIFFRCRIPNRSKCVTVAGGHSDVNGTIAFSTIVFFFFFFFFFFF